jgi:hypothetical protein
MWPLLYTAYAVMSMAHSMLRTLDIYVNALTSINVRLELQA